MKKLSILAAMLLTLGFTACVEIDNPVDDGRQTISLDGKNYKVDLIGTFAGEVGSEVTLKLGSYDEYDFYGVDFGDGNIVSDTVGYQNHGVYKDGAPKPGTTHTGITQFQGTISGDGIVKVYGNSAVWYAGISGGLVPTSLASDKLNKIVQMTISGAVVEDLDLKDLPLLEQFSFTQGSVTSINVADNPELTNLSINNNTASKFESKLAALDVSKNTKLEFLNVMGASADKPGLLTTLDLSNNTALDKVYVQFNKLTSIKLPAGANITFLNVQNNELKELDLSGLAGVKDIYASDNKLTAIDLSKLTAKATLNLYNNELTKLEVPVDVKTLDAENNKIAEVSIKDVTAKLALKNNELTFSALPALPAGLKEKVAKYTYAPQNAIVPVTLDFIGAADLTKEYGPFKGITENDNLTKFVFIGDDAEMPTANYQEKDGKVKFLHVYNKIYGKLTNEAFPGLELTTTEFAIRTYGTSVYQMLYTYDFAAAAAAGENPTNFNGGTATGQVFYGWEKVDKTDSKRQDYKGYVWADGSVLPKDCHVWRRTDRINGNIKNGGLYCPNEREMAIDGLEPGYLVEIFYDGSKAAEGKKEAIWAIGDGTSTDGLGTAHATAKIDGTDAVIGVTPIASGAKIEVKSVTPPEKGTGYIVFKVYKDMVITKVIISKPTE